MHDDKHACSYLEQPIARKTDSTRTWDLLADIEQLPVYRSHYFRVRLAVSPVLGHFSALHAQLERALWTVKSYLFDIAVEIRLSFPPSFWRIRAFARSFVAPFGIISSDNSFLWPYREGFVAQHGFVTTFLALMPVPSLWKIGSRHRSLVHRARKIRITERYWIFFFFFFF